MENLSFIESETLEDALLFLDELRESRKVNMYYGFTAIREEFDFSEEEAKIVFMHWKKVFSQRHSNKK